MRQLGTVLRPSAALVGLALIIFGVWAGGGSGCTLLLDTGASPYRCSSDADCAHLPNAVCDNARKECVPRLPYGDGGTPDTGAGGTSGLTCQMTFDNGTRLHQSGPDGGLVPLPGGP